MAPPEPGRADDAPAGDRLTDIARGALETAVGLGVLGLMRARAEQPRMETGLTRRGLEPLAALSRSAAGVVDQVVLALLQPTAPAPPPPTPSPAPPAGGPDPAAPRPTPAAGPPGAREGAGEPDRADG